MPILLFSHSVVSDSWGPHGLQHTRLPCPSLSPEVCSNSCPLSRRCQPTISSYHPLLLLPSILPSIRVFSNELALHIRWPKYWSFSLINKFSMYSGARPITSWWKFYGIMLLVWKYIIFAKLPLGGSQMAQMQCYNGSPYCMPLPYLLKRGGLVCFALLCFL